MAPGTGLIGAVFPKGTGAYDDDGTPIADRGWRALLLATGDPDAIMATYFDQAAEAGLPLSPESGGPLCLLDLGLLSCTAASRIGPPSDGRGVRVALHRLPPEKGQVPLSHVTISYSETGDAARAGRTSTTRATTTEGLPQAVLDELEEKTIDDPSSIELPRRWPPLVRSGDRLRGGSFAFGGVSVSVEAGSVLAAPVGVTTQCIHETFAAVLRVTADPLTVAKAYGRQFKDRGGDLRGGEVETRREGRATVYSVSNDVAGGPSWISETVVRPGEPTWMLIETCYDA